MKLSRQDISDVFLRSYVDYARYVITQRALSDYRDGLKPVQRRIIYSMYDNNQFLDAHNGKTYKSARIVGDTMGKYHPHGDSGIYGALVQMTDDYDYMMLPMVKGNGHFSRPWTTDVAASMRYTEVALNKCAREMFDGLKEDAIDMVPNYDDSELEPDVLPVKFPSVLVNNTMGIAVGYASNMPMFSMGKVCEATSKLIKGKIKDIDELMEFMGYPDFKTKGNLHRDESALRSLFENGKGSFSVSGSVVIKGNKIHITEIPPAVTVEKIMEQISDAIDSKKITDITDFKNSSGTRNKKDGAKLGIEIELKRGAEPRKVLTQLCRYTSLRDTISYKLFVLIDNKPCIIGIYDLLKNWVEWRQTVVQRQYSFKAKGELESIHLLEAFELIKADIKEVVRIIASYKESEANEMLMSNYGLDKDQIEYLYERKIRTLTQDKLDNELVKLEKKRENVVYYMSIVDNKEDRLKLIAEQLDELAKAYPSVRFSRVADSIKTNEEDELLNEKVEDSEVHLLVTAYGYVKRATTLEAVLDLKTKYEGTEDEVVKIIKTNNLESLLVFTSNGECIKYPVHKIDNNSRTKFNENIKTLCKIPDEKEIVFFDCSGDYSKEIVVIYQDGRANYLSYAYLNGKRSKYKSLFESYAGEKGIVTDRLEPMYLITEKGKAVFNNMGGFSGVNPMLRALMPTKSKFRIAQIGNDTLKGIVYKSDALDIDTEEYDKRYAVKIRTPIFESEDKIVKLL